MGPFLALLSLASRMTFGCSLQDVMRMELARMGSAWMGKTALYMTQILSSITPFLIAAQVGALAALGPDYQSTFSPLESDAVLEQTPAAAALVVDGREALGAAPAAQLQRAGGASHARRAPPAQLCPPQGRRSDRQALRQ